MKFSDFEKDYTQLIGQLVLNETGISYGNKRLKIRKIVKVTKTGFKIEDSDSLYNFGGVAKGNNGRMNMGRIDSCVLLTENEAMVMKIGWNIEKRKKQLILEITEKIKTADNKTLEKINELLNPETDEDTSSTNQWEEGRNT